MKKYIWHLCPAILFATAARAAEPEMVAAQSVTPAPTVTQLPGWQSAPGNASDWADRCTDTTINGWGFKNPKNFPPLVKQFSDPAIYLEFAKRMQDPEFYARTLGRMLDPATARNYLEWSDPVIYARWLQALADPNFLNAAMQPLADPGNLIRWAALPIYPASWSVGLNMANPEMWLKWMTAPLNPKVMAPLVKMADLNMPLRWLQTATTADNFKLFTGGLSPTHGQGSNVQGTTLAALSPGSQGVPPGTARQSTWPDSKIDGKP